MDECLDFVTKLNRKSLTSALKTRLFSKIIRISVNIKTKMKTNENNKTE